MNGDALVPFLNGISVSMKATTDFWNAITVAVERKSKNFDVT